jgi:TatD DNase family protein
VIDFHCHVDLYPDPEAIVAQAREKGVYVLAVTTTPLAWQGTSDLIADAPRIKVALGLHPELVAERHAEVELLCSGIMNAKYIGEIGLDGSPPHRHSLALQRQVFDRILQACATHGGRIMTIHSRGAASAVLDALDSQPAAGTAVLHWFSGTRRELDRAAALGCWFSVGPAMLHGEKGRSLVSAMPRDRVITETDGPFARQGNDPLMPWDVDQAISHLAHLWDIPVDEAAAVVEANFKRLLTYAEVSRRGVQ